MSTEIENKPLERLMRYCSRAERSTGDCLRLMRTWGVDERMQVAIIARLVELRFVDDERFARAYVRDKSEFAGWGVRKIELGLRTKGVAKETISNALSELDMDYSRERLTELLERKLRTIKTGTPYEIRGKLFRFAMGRGYEYDQVIDAIENIMVSS